MRIRDIIQLGILVICFLLISAGSIVTSETDSRPDSSPTLLSLFDSFTQETSLWKQIAEDFQLQYDPDRESIAEQIRWFSHEHEYIGELTRNARPYIYYIYQETQKRHMPAELALLPMLESNYKPMKNSHAGAIGLWQMMRGTASGLGVRINAWYDGRRNVIDSTNAALNYLAYLHGLFGNWLLAIAAYDSGEGTVEAAIKHNRRLHKPTDFWSLPLPKETKSYVPRLLALSSIIKDPKQYDVKLNAVPNKPFFKAVPVNKRINLSRVASISHTELKTIKALNSGLKKEVTVPHQHILLPINKADIFLQHVNSKKNMASEASNKSELPKKPLNSLKSEDSTSQDKGGVQLLATVHHLSEKISSQKPHHSQPEIIRIARKNTRLHQSDIKKEKTEFYNYRVKAGDNLHKIAEHYRVDSRKLKLLNHLHHTDVLQIGEHLEIPKET